MMALDVLTITLDRVSNGVCGVRAWNGVLIGSIYAVESGEYVFDPSPQRTGYWPHHMINSIAVVLADMNKPLWDDMEAYFDAHPTNGDTVANG